MRTLTLELKPRKPLNQNDQCRYEFTITDGTVFRRVYQRHDANPDALLTAVADLLPHINPSLIKTMLTHSEGWKYEKELEDDRADALFASLPPNTCVARFSFRPLSSGDCLLVCIPYGGMTAPEYLSPKHYSNVKELMATLESLGVTYPGGIIIPAMGFVVRCQDLLDLGFKRDEVAQL